MTRRVVVEEPCEHGMHIDHYVVLGREPCNGPKRRVLTEGQFVLVEKVAGEWPEDALDRGRKQPKSGVPNFRWKRSTVADILDVLAGGSS